VSIENRSNQPHLVLTDLPPSGEPGPSMLEALGHQVHVLMRAHEEGHPDAARLLRSFGLALGSEAEILASRLVVERARELVAREHGFKDWAAVVRNGEMKIDAGFEAAVDAIVRGELEDLTRFVQDAPRLVRARSAYPHHSTLLHHCSANGIEHTRQWQSPANAPDIARALLAAGADPDATCDVYRGGHATTPLSLLVSSGPPALAGVQDALVEVLCKAGANPDGLGGYRPLWAAIVFGYSRSVERLASCGASVDNVIFAAAVGNLDLVKSLVAAGRDSLASSPSAQRIGPTGPALAPDRMLEYALIYASGHARVDVVEYLLSMDLDLTVKEPMWNSTALGWAKHYREVNGRLDDKEATIRLLERHAAAAGMRGP
jgi:hypothetical protein